jgi:hypothetical protein
MENSFLITDDFHITFLEQVNNLLLYKYYFNVFV